MSTLKSNKFSTYDHSERELAESRIYSTLQREGIMNIRAGIAEQILALTFDPINPVAFGLEQAHLTGQLASLDFLLDTDQEARNALLELARRESNNS